MRFKNVASVVFVCLLLMALTVQIFPLASSGATTLTINTPTLPSGHETHLPLLDGGFWLNTGTLASPVWTYYPWGATVYPTPGTVNEFDIRVPAQVRDSRGGNPVNGTAHSFKIAEWPSVVVVSGPEAEAAEGGIAVPTYRLRLDPAGPATTTPVLKRAGPQIDVLRWKVIRSPDAQYVAMRVGEADVWGCLASPMDVFWHGLAEADGQLRPVDIGELRIAGFTIPPATDGFHIGHIGYNIRPLEIQQLRRPELTYWPLADVEFRHALFHCFDQQAILRIFDPAFSTVTPLYDLVPPALGGWVNPFVQTHPYNPGDPFATTVYPEDHSSCGILRAAGYVFHDNKTHGTIGVVDTWNCTDYWNCTNGDPMPRMKFLIPTFETAPTSWEICHQFFLDLTAIGLRGMPYNRTDGGGVYEPLGNGNKGFELDERDFTHLINVEVWQCNFDAYMLFWNLHRFPDYLYDMCHSSQDAWLYPGRNNLPGIIDPMIDYYVETIQLSLNHQEKLAAAHELQRRLYNETYSYALSYMPLYSERYHSAFNPDLRGIVNSPGFGTHNKWTLLNIRWEPGSAGEIAHRIDENPPGGVYDEPPRHFINWILQDIPGWTLNPLYEQSKYSWAIMSPVMDGLIMVNPFTHEDLPWLAESWEEVETPTGMNITFHLRKDMFWQDGNPYTAHDAKFNWLFLRDNHIPRFDSTAKFIQDVVVIDDYTVRAVLNVTSQFLIYDLAATAAMLPPPVWRWLDGAPLEDILYYEPSINTTKPWLAGPWFSSPQGPSTQLYGTGPFAFDFYDIYNMYGELHQFPGGCFRITDDIYAQIVDMFYKVGDCSSQTQGVGYSDGIIWNDDRTQMGFRYARNKILDPTLYHAYVDVNSDDWIDIVDLSLANLHFGEQREYP